MHNMHNVCFYSFVCILRKRRKKSKINKLKIKLQSNQKGARGRLSSSRRQHGRKHPPRRRPPTADRRPAPPAEEPRFVARSPTHSQRDQGVGDQERERESAGVEDCLRARRRSGTAPPDPPSLPSSGSWRQAAGGGPGASSAGPGSAGWTGRRAGLDIFSASICPFRFSTS